MCGILGVYANRPRLLYDILNKGTELNIRRGPDSFGVSFSNPNFNDILTTQYVRNKDINPLSEANRKNAHYRKIQDNVLSMKAIMGISQTRYSTDQRTTDDDHDAKQISHANTQPIHIDYLTPFCQRGIGAQNGNIPPNEKKRLEDLVGDEKSNHKATVDTKVYTELYMKKLREYHNDYFKAAEWIIRNVRGTASFIYSDGKNMIAFKDQYTNRPLCLMSNDDCKIIASESNIATVLGGIKFKRELKLGEIIKIDSEGNLESRQIEGIETKNGFCKLERIYLMDYRSRLPNEKRSIDDARWEYGANYVKRYPEILEGMDIVVSVPESGNSYTRGVAFEAHMKSVKAISKPDKKRNFLGARNGKNRGKNTAGHKFCVQETDVEGENILLIDDSIIRGDTIARLYIDLQLAGAKNVTLASMWPANAFHCDKGTDTQTNKELIAYKLVERGIIHPVNKDFPELGYTYDLDKVNESLTELIQDYVMKVADKEGFDVDPTRFKVHLPSVEFLNEQIPEGCTTCLNKVELDGWIG